MKSWTALNINEFILFDMSLFKSCGLCMTLSCDFVLHS